MIRDDSDRGWQWSAMIRIGDDSNEWGQWSGMTMIRGENDQWWQWSGMTIMISVDNNELWQWSGMTKQGGERQEEEGGEGRSTAKNKPQTMMWGTRLLVLLFSACFHAAWCSKPFSSHLLVTSLCSSAGPVFFFTWLAVFKQRLTGFLVRSYGGLVQLLVSRPQNEKMWRFFSLSSANHFWIKRLVLGFKLMRLKTRWIVTRSTLGEHVHHLTKNRCCKFPVCFII